MSSLEIALLILFIAASAFMSLAEISLVGISKIRLHHMVTRGVRRAKMVQGLVSRLDHVITTILVWSNFINAALTSLLTAACIYWFKGDKGVFIAALLSGSVILLFTDILPKVYAARFAERVALGVAPAMWVFVRFSRPVSETMNKLINAILKFVGVPVSDRSPLVTEEELKLMIELGRKEGFLGEHERKLLHRIFEFGDLKVKDVMVPRDQMVTVQDSADHEEVLRVLTEEGHLRVPVYRDSPDHIVGIIYAQELLHIWREGWLIVLQDLIHPPFEVSADARVVDLLEEFQRNRIQIAIVVDQNKKAVGLVTLEDLVEEIVGEVPEKHKEGWLDRPEGA